MALDPVKLDDLNWSEMTLAIRRRIAAASGGVWTLHSPADPGVTMLELFAWLLEQRVYWMDQTPDSMTRAALKLLGEAPEPTGVARAVFRLQPPGDDPLTVPALTPLRLERSQPSITFSTCRRITLLPFSQTDGQHGNIDLIIGNRDMTADLEQGKTLDLFPADGRAAEAKIVLKPSRPIEDKDAGKRFSIFFDLDASSGIQPQWSPEAASGILPPAGIKWFYRSVNSSEPRQFNPTLIDDGTGGMRRPGLVTIAIPKDWAPEPEGLNRYGLLMRVEKSTFTYPPRIRRLIPNVVIASHLRRAKHELSREWLPLPGNILELAELPEQVAAEKDHPPIESSVSLRIRERDGAWHSWKLTSDLAFHGSADRVFTVDRLKGELRFGDGLTGRLPVPAGKSGKQFKVSYRVGGGTAGNIGDSRWWTGVVGTTSFRAINVTPATGGAEPESTASASERVASELRRTTRAVTAVDYEELARTTPGIAIKRARVAIGFHPDHPCTQVPGAVTVFIIPDAPRSRLREENFSDELITAPLPDPGALAAVRERLDKTRLITTEVFVLPARYRPVTITITIESGVADQSTLRTGVERAIRTILDPLVGGSTGNGWPFGEPLRPSAIIRAARQALDDQGEVVSAAIRLMDQPGDELKPDGEDCFDVEIGPHDVVEVKQIKIRIRASLRSEGGLR